MNVKDFDFRLWNNEAKMYFKTRVEFERGKVRLIPENDDRLEIELWSGCRDKNGTKIFEGDIVEYKYGHANYDHATLLVSYERPTWLLRGFNAEKSMQFCLGIELKNVSQTSRCDENKVVYESPKLEVIGNSHENKDLLEKGCEMGISQEIQPSLIELSSKFQKTILDIDNLLISNPDDCDVRQKLIETIIHDLTNNYEHIGNLLAEIVYASVKNSNDVNYKNQVLNMIKQKIDIKEI